MPAMHLAAKQHAKDETKWNMVGKTLSHYRVIQELGAGGMGVVYLARDETLDRQVALKVLPRGSLADEAARKRLRKEALALAKLRHPNIETIYELGSQDGVDFLVRRGPPREEGAANACSVGATSVAVWNVVGWHASRGCCSERRFPTSFASGIELAKNIQNANRGIAIVLMTGYGPPEIAE
jgi:hypothetical protein